MENQGVENALFGRKSSRGPRKPRAQSSSLGRAIGILLLCVCVVSIVAASILFTQISSLKLENGGGHRTGFLSRKQPAVQSLRAENELFVMQSVDEGSKEWEEEIAVSDGAERHVVSRIGFGSCTSRVAMEQPIWTDAIIPSDIQAWIWAGDIAYMDWPDVNCAEHPSHPHCSCIRNWLHSNPDSCLAGDLVHARFKLEEQLQNVDYVKFVEFMCPASKEHTSRIRDLSLCKRPIFGTWDDHDYNWQDGDKRMPTKEEQKHLFLDVFGVPTQSHRRRNGRGIYWRHTLNEGIAGKEIDVLLLDERFHRDSKPCHTRQDLCKLTKPYKTKYIWCQDFLQGGSDGMGSCCKKDDKIWREWEIGHHYVIQKAEASQNFVNQYASTIRGWCMLPANRGNPSWDQVCNPKSESYGLIDVTVDTIINSSTVGVSSSINMNDEDSSADAGVLCEVLGPPQRRWLQKQLKESRATLKLVVSGSPLFSNPTNFTCSQARGKRPGAYCRCYDDFDCFQPAQQNLLHTIATASGCVVVLTGDFHFSDIKPGSHSYSDYYGSTDLPRPIVQVMASGLTNNTAVPAPCQGFRVDNVGLRPDGACAFVSGPAFGLIEVDWDALPPVVRVQIRGDTGEVRQEQKLSLQSCLPLS